jgi:hypothetical protein
MRISRWGTRAMGGRNTLVDKEKGFDEPHIVSSFPISFSSPMAASSKSLSWGASTPPNPLPPSLTGGALFGLATSDL